MSQNKADIEKGNADFAAKFTQGDLPLPPARKLLVLACMDARLHVGKALGLNIGDSHIVRNAGGRATPDAIRSISISQRLLGTTEIVVVHHSDCGMLTFTDESIRSKIKADLGADAHDASVGVAFYPFPDLEESVRADVRLIKASKLVQPGTPVYGYIYDVKTGKLNEVHV